MGRYSNAAYALVLSLLFACACEQYDGDVVGASDACATAVTQYRTQAYDGARGSLDTAEKLLKGRTNRDLEFLRIKLLMKDHEYEKALELSKAFLSAPPWEGREASFRDVETFAAAEKIDYEDDLQKRMEKLEEWAAKQRDVKPGESGEGIGNALKVMVAKRAPEKTWLGSDAIDIGPKNDCLAAADRDACLERVKASALRIDSKARAVEPTVCAGGEKPNIVSCSWKVQVEHVNAPYQYDEGDTVKKGMARTIGETTREVVVEFVVKEDGIWYGDTNVGEPESHEPGELAELEGVDNAVLHKALGAAASKLAENWSKAFSGGRVMPYDPVQLAAFRTGGSEFTRGVVKGAEM